MVLSGLLTLVVASPLRETATPPARLASTPDVLQEERAPAGALQIAGGEPAADPPAPRAEPEAPTSPSASDLCRDALASAAKVRLPLPPGVDYRCPSSQYAHHGTACWDWGPCRGGGFIAINLDLLAGRSPEYVRHVVAHEVCHILDFQGWGASTEASADACASAHGT